MLLKLTRSNYPFKSPSYSIWELKRTEDKREGRLASLILLTCTPHPIRSEDISKNSNPQRVPVGWTDTPTPHQSPKWTTSMATEEPITKDLESKNQTYNWHFPVLYHRLLFLKILNPFPKFQTVLLSKKHVSETQDVHDQNYKLNNK